MIDAIKEIGRYSVEKEGKSLKNPLDILVDNPTNKFTKNILFIEIINNNNQFEYNGINNEEYSKNNLKKYLYKKGSPNGTDITPTAMITDIKKTFKKKIFNWFEDHKEVGLDDNQNFLVKIGNCLRKNEDQILTDLEEKYNKESNVVSLKINNKYIGDYHIFGEILVNKAKEGFYFTKSFSGKNQYSKSNNQICSVCNKKTEVYGFVNTFNFYTVDKPGFVSGGFAQKDAWKNYPVCLDCALLLEEGKKYMEEEDNLRFDFYGLKYFLIPKFAGEVNENTKIKVLEKIEKQKNPKYRDNEIIRLTNAENEILNMLEKESNYMNINFMFYDKSNSAFNILLYIEDILPSRLSLLFYIKEEIDKKNIFKECPVPGLENKKKTGEKPLEFNFEILRTFFYSTQNKEWISKKYFLDIVNKTFTNKQVDYDFLMKFIVQKIRDEFLNKHPTKISTLKGFMLLNYLNDLKILKMEKGDKMEESTIREFEENKENIKEIEKKINSFFDEFRDFFCNNDAKKAVFLEGVLAQKLLNIQRLPEVSNAKPGKEPFRHNLKGLKLDEKEIKRILPKIQNKLEEYGKNYYSSIETTISNHLVSAGNDWKMSNDEISFYFVLGMNLAYKFKKEKENKEGE